MATIRFRRGDSNPTAAIQPTGLTMGEPVFNKELNTFWIGGSGPDGFTAIWVGAEIENTLSLENASPYKLATQYAIVNQIKTIVGASAGVQTIAGLSGTVSLVFGTGISGSTSAGAITLQNTGVTRLGLSGDWRTRGVTNFGGAATGGVTLASEVWQGGATFSLNSVTKFGALTTTTSLTGKTPMEILELMLFEYLTPTFASFTTGFSAERGIASAYTTTLPYGVSADFGTNSNLSWTTTNTQNIVGGATVTISTATSVVGPVANTVLLTPTEIPNTTANSYSGFTWGVAIKGIGPNSSGDSQVQFRITGRTAGAGTFSTTSTIINWYPRIFYGWTADPGLTYPYDSWKSIGVLNSGTTSGRLMPSSMNKTLPAMTLTTTETGDPPGGGSQYFYFWLDSYYNVAYTNIKDNNNQTWGVDGATGVLINGITIDDGVSTRSYRRYRSTDALAGAQTIKIGYS